MVASPRGTLTAGCPRPVVVPPTSTTAQVSRAGQERPRPRMEFRRPGREPSRTGYSRALVDVHQGAVILAEVQAALPGPGPRRASAKPGGRPAQRARAGRALMTVAFSPLEQPPSRPISLRHADMHAGQLFQEQRRGLPARVSALTGLKTEEMGDRADAKPRSCSCGRPQQLTRDRVGKSACPSNSWPPLARR